MDYSNELWDKGSWHDPVKLHICVKRKSRQGKAFVQKINDSRRNGLLKSSKKLEEMGLVTVRRTNRFFIIQSTSIGLTIRL